MTPTPETMAEAERLIEFDYYECADADEFNMEKTKVAIATALQSRDDEIARLKANYKAMCEVAQHNHQACEKLRALADELAETLGKAAVALAEAFNRVHCLPRQTDNVLASRIDDALYLVQQRIAKHKESRE